MYKKIILWCICILSLYHLQAQATDTYQTIQVGTFTLLNWSDFDKLHAYGYVYAQPLSDTQDRVFVGGFTSEKQAQHTLEKVRQAGYQDAFIVTLPTHRGKEVASVQLGTFQHNAPVNWAKYLNVGDIYVLPKDGQIKILSGQFPDASQAKNQLNRAKNMGFTTAFIKMAHPATLHYVNQHDTGGLLQTPIEVVDVVPIEYATIGNYAQPVKNTKPQSETLVARGGKATLTHIPRATDKPTLVAIRTRRNTPTGTKEKQPATKTFIPKEAPSTSNNARLRKSLPGPHIRIKTQRRSVQWLQQLLHSGGYYTTTIDGIYGPKTAAAYRSALEDKPLLETHRYTSAAADLPRDCRAWESVQLLMDMATQIDVSTFSAEQEKAFVQSFLEPEHLDANTLQLLVSWDYRFRRGLKKWVADDPLRTKLADALMLVYWQSQVHLEDYFSGKGFSNQQAQGLALQTLKRLVGHHLERFQYF